MHTSYFHEGGIIFMIVRLLVCLFVIRITQILLVESS